MYSWNNTSEVFFKQSARSRLSIPKIIYIFNIFQANDNNKVSDGEAENISLQIADVQHVHVFVLQLKQHKAFDILALKLA